MQKWVTEYEQRNNLFVMDIKKKQNTHTQACLFLHQFELKKTVMRTTVYFALVFCSLLRNGCTVYEWY